MSRMTRQVIEFYSRSDGDPLRELEKREAQTCAGCCWSGKRYGPDGKPDGTMACRRGLKWGKRCKDYLDS